ncbi:hypothetical protein H9L19_04365 [Weissella diestrammenae]|uniref:Peptidase C1A papain C-terminal domain-containing protein n=1 Tax=Weissella diestrammenae TaxID=1162633 RepID=A0A7G9T3K0_9LACO|nr:hypothetical protein [Weissella diestrammenae]MCM0582646.1 hypothetical protein [Weissella diestrammenae]QNN74675.1 hypothetical protein H9L19_04365 [Weissella diestrammenae]
MKRYKSAFMLATILLSVASPVVVKACDTQDINYETDDKSLTTNQYNPKVPIDEAKHIDEFKSYLLNQYVTQPGLPHAYSLADAHPDWVTPVRTQGIKSFPYHIQTPTGTCWAHAMTENMAVQYAKMFSQANHKITPELIQQSPSFLMNTAVNQQAHPTFPVGTYTIPGLGINVPTNPVLSIDAIATQGAKDDSFTASVLSSGKGVAPRSEFSVFRW